MVDEPRHPDGSVVDVVDRGKPPTIVIEVSTDRCDECGAEAFVFAMFKTGSLAWCGHHGTEHWDAIVAQAITAPIDWRDHIGATTDSEDDDD